MTREFDIEIVKRGRSEYQCFGCLEKIPKGVTHLVMKCATNGKFYADRICVRCGFICTRKQKNKGELHRGELQEHLLANCLRKEWKEIMRTGKYVIRQSKTDPCSQNGDTAVCAVIPNKQFESIRSGKRRFAFVRQYGKYTIGDFAPGKIIKFRTTSKTRSECMERRIRMSKLFATEETMKSIETAHPCFALFLEPV